MKGRHVTEKRGKILKKMTNYYRCIYFSLILLQEELSKSSWFILFSESRKPSEVVKQLLIERKKLSSKFVSELFPASLTEQYYKNSYHLLRI